jgi:P27 family predicted phage terminase small subunit
MPRGRKPIGDRPLTPAERKRRFLEAKASRPEPPMVLDAIAMREWRRLAGVLRERNALHEIDHGSLAAYCQMYSRWVAAEKALARMAELDPVAGGLMIKTSNGNAIQNPLVGIANKAAAAMVKYAGEFGMTPNSRGQVQVAEPITDAAPAPIGKKEQMQQAADHSRFTAMSTPKLIVDNAG